MISSGVIESPTAISSADQTANLPSMANPEPLTETDSMATDTNTLSGSTAKPSFSLLQPTVAGPLASAYYPDWVSATIPPENTDMTHFDRLCFRDP